MSPAQFALDQFTAAWNAVTVAQALTAERDHDGSTAALAVLDHTLTEWGQRLSLDSDGDEFDAAFVDLARLIEIARKFHGDPDADDVAFLLQTAEAAIDRARARVAP